MLERSPPPTDLDAKKREQRRLAQRRYRRNTESHVKIAPTPFDATMLDYLIRLHWLDEADAKDRRKVGEAIARALLESAKAER